MLRSLLQGLYSFGCGIVSFQELDQYFLDPPLHIDSPLRILLQIHLLLRLLRLLRLAALLELVVGLSGRFWVSW